MKLLIVEDDPKTADSVQRGLEAEGHSVAVARTGDEGLAAIRSGVFDLVILDWMLPGRDGIELLRELRRSGEKPPVLLLTARDSVEDRVLGLDSGADDYLVKPFAFAELLARLRALLRRSGPEIPLRYHIADLQLDWRSRQVRRGEDEILLTPREFEVLHYLMRAEGQVVTRAMLAQEVWREPNRSTPLDNVIDVHLARLRKKIDEGRPTRLIHTIRGVGFACAEKPSSAPGKP
jgi:two-component system copper resistance phosphate regulon response regulator CusR